MTYKSKSQLIIISWNYRLTAVSKVKKPVFQFQLLPWHQVLYHIMACDVNRMHNRTCLSWFSWYKKPEQWNQDYPNPLKSHQCPPSWYSPVALINHKRLSDNASAFAHPLLEMNRTMERNPRQNWACLPYILPSWKVSIWAELFPIPPDVIEIGQLYFKIPIECLYLGEICSYSIYRQIGFKKWILKSKSLFFIDLIFREMPLSFTNRLIHKRFHRHLMKWFIMGYSWAICSNSTVFIVLAMKKPQANHWINKE